MSWDLRTGDMGQPGTYVVDEGGNPIAEVIDDEHEDLLASAPDLLAALHHMRICASCAQGDWNDCDGGREALAVMTRIEGSR